MVDIAQLLSERGEVTGNSVKQGQEQVEEGQDQLHHHVGLQAGYGGALSLVEGHS